jgi:hypothetical protein
LNGIKNAAATATWTEGEFQEQAPKASVCADKSIESKRILEICGWRWRIGTFFQSMKAVEFDSYQVRDMQTIANYWSLFGIFHVACRIGLGAETKFSEGIEMMRTQSLREYAENTVNDTRRGKT